MAPAWVLLWPATAVAGGPVIAIAGWSWGYAGSAALFCSIGAVLLMVFAPVRPAARAAQRRRRGVVVAAAWLLPVLAVGVAGELALPSVLH